jgi:hypothetical protein
VSRYRPQMRLAFLGALAVVSGAGAEPPADLSVKADYLGKLAPFVSWPASPAAANAPFVVCVQGNDPFGPVLDRELAGQTAFARPMVVRRVAHLEPDSGCQIAYVAGSPDQSQAAALHAVAGAPVLTVTDSDRGSGERGIIDLILAEGRVKFSVDLAQAKQNGLSISSKLLALAVKVTR